MAFNTKLNLIDQKFYQSVAGTLALSGTTSVGTAKYLTDKSSTYTARSLADAAYVTGKTSTSGVQTANNGLTKLGTNLVFGGNLTGDTTLGLANKSLSISGGFANLAMFDSCGTDMFLPGFINLYYFDLSGGTFIQSSLQQQYGCQRLAVRDVNSPYNSKELNISWTGDMTVTDSERLKGLIYGGDYSSKFVARSIPDAAWVTGKTSTAGIQTASSGLTKVGTVVRLGGTLTGPTTLTANNGSQLTFTDARTTPLGIQYGGDYGTTFTARSLVDAGYVTGKTSTSGVQTANNGLCKQGTNVRLGGSLTGATTIVVDSTLTLNGTVGQSFSFGPLGTQLSQCTSNLTITNSGADVHLSSCTGKAVLLGVNALVYCGDYDSCFLARSLADAQYVTGLTSALSGRVSTIEGKYVTGATNGITKTGAHDLCLGGAITQNTCLSGAYEFDLNMNKVNITGATGGVNLGGNLFLKTVPTNASGDVLTIDNITGEVTKTTLSSLGGLTGATNGLHTLGQNVHLGGVLIENTLLQGAYCFDVDAVRGFNVRTSGNTDMNIDAQQCGGFLIKSQCGSIDTFPDFTCAVGFLGHITEPAGFAIYDNRNGASQTGIVYAADYSANYVDRSLVDKKYVDTVATGLQVHQAAELATKTNITLSGNQTIDGILTTTGMRVLVKNQATGTENGIYSASTGSWTRTTDFNFSPPGEVTNGDMIPVTSGTTQNNTIWVLTTPNPIVSGVTSLEFTLFATVLDLAAGQGIAISTVGGVHTICTELATNCGLTFCGNGLAVNPNIAGIALTYTNGVVDVCAANCGSVGAIPVGYNVAECLVVACSDIIAALGTPINTAVNGLTKSGTEVKLGGTITGATTLTLSNLGTPSLTLTDSRIAPEGIIYGGNYSGSFVDRSLVDKGWVNNNLTGATSPLTYVNGLTHTGTKVCLGGTLCSGSTSVSYPNSTIFSIGAGNPANFFGGRIDVSRCDSSLCSNYVVIGARCGAGSRVTLGIIPTGLTINSTDAGFKGAVYASDYSANFVDESLITKKYVCSQTSGITACAITTANNGLTKSGQNVHLGGALTGATNIFVDTYPLTISGLTESTRIQIDGTNDYVALGDYDLSALNYILLNATQFDLYHSNGVCNSQIFGSAACLKSTYSIPATIAATQQMNNSGICLSVNDTSTVCSELVIGIGTITLGGCAGFPGAQYNANYRANFVCNSLVDAAYVTGKTSTAGVQTVNNGLTKFGTNAVLGGPLTGSTLVNINTHTLCLSGASGQINLGAGGNNGNGRIVVGLGSVSVSAKVSGSNCACIAFGCDVDVTATNGGITLSSTGAGAAGRVNLTATHDICINPTATGATTLVGTVCLQTTPSAGLTSDSVIVWNSSDKKLKTVVGSSLGDKNNIYSNILMASACTLTTGSSYVILVDSTNPVTLTLPAVPKEGQAFKIKDATGNALTNSITICGGGNDIDGALTALVNTDFGALELMYTTQPSGWYTLSFVN